MPFIPKHKYFELLARISNSNQEHDLLKYNSQSLQENIRSIARILDAKANTAAEQIVGIRQTKYGEFVLLTTYAQEYNLILSIYSSCYSKSDCYLVGALHKEDSCATIIDIIGETSLGYGSILLSYFVELCTVQKIETIRGNLSLVDSDHFDRSEKFYKKHGFEVVFNDKHTNGVMTLKIEHKSKNSYL